MASGAPHLWFDKEAIQAAEFLRFYVFGVPQIVPARLEQIMSEGTKEQVDRVTQAFLQMKKLDLAELEKAYQGS